MAHGRLLIIILLSVAVVTFGTVQLWPSLQRSSVTSHVTVHINGQSYSLEVAADPTSIETGLMGRESISTDGGMLFVFDSSGYRTFWMKNCLTDIDLIFLDSQGRIVALHEMTTEPLRRDNESAAAYEARLRTYESSRPAMFAIELRAGSIRDLGLRVAERIELDLPRLKAMRD